MDTRRTSTAYKKEMQITLQDLYHQLGIQQDAHLSPMVTEELIPRGGSQRSTMTNKIMRRAHAAVFVIIVLVTVISELTR